MKSVEADGQRPTAGGARVSCIMIFLNGEAHIREAIESVLDQNHGDWELILVDDGTTDGATAIARGYADAHPGRVIYTRHPGHENRGMCASRNAGLRLARGEYVAFLDADDIWLPDRLTSHVALMDRHSGVAMSMGPTLYWSSWTRTTCRSRGRGSPPMSSTIWACPASRRCSRRRSRATTWTTTAPTCPGSAAC